MPRSDAMYSRVFLVDDHPLFRFGLRHLLACDPAFGVCGEASTLADARRFARELEPDLMILDLSLPDGDGLTLLEESRDWARPPAVIILTMREEDDPACLDALRVGAAGFVNKREPLGEMVEIVRSVCKGETRIGERAMQLIVGRQASAAARCALGRESS